MSVTSYEFLIITVFPKKEIRAEPSRAEGGSAAGNGTRSASVLLCGLSLSTETNRKTKIEYLPRLPRYLGQIVACKGIRLKFTTAEMRKYCNSRSERCSIISA